MARSKRGLSGKKFRKVSFKLSARERKKLEQCSSMESMTLNKFIKSAIREKMYRYKERLEEIEQNQVSENQLKLFGEEDDQ
ncbi:MAG: hypothetical protein R6U19_09310 [Bacteroidales bacterium]